MSFDVKYHIQAENELKMRKQANFNRLVERRREIETAIPEYAVLRTVMASTAARIAQTVISGTAFNADYENIGSSDNSENIGEKLAAIQKENTAAAAKIKELLIKSRKPADYLDPIYSCKVCRDTGIVNGGRCECYINAVKRFAAEGINSASPLTLTGFDSFDVELYPDELKDGFSIRDIMRGNFNYCRKYAEEFRLPNAGIILSGKTGLGKTHLSLAIAGTVLGNGFNAVYGSAPDLFRKVENEHFGREDGNTMDALQAAELLVLDDIGAEFESKFYVSVFYNLLNTRMNSGKATVISTNLDMGELRRRYGERIMSRFLTMEILAFYGCDIRQVMGS